jgi:hypothetical protein
MSVHMSSECRNHIVVIAEDIDLRIEYALRFARTVSDDITVCCVVVSDDDEERLRKRWVESGKEVPLVLLRSPDGSVANSLLEYIQTEEFGCKPGELVTVVLVRFVPARRWHKLLHQRAFGAIERRLLESGQVAVLVLPYTLIDDGEALTQAL